MTIGFREFCIIVGIVGVMIWMRMLRTSVEENTTQFFRKLKGPQGDGGGFGWRGLLISFFVGIALCCGFAFVVLRIWIFYHPAATMP